MVFCRHSQIPRTLELIPTILLLIIKQKNYAYFSILTLAAYFEWFIYKLWRETVVFEIQDKNLRNSIEHVFCPSHR